MILYLTVEDATDVIQQTLRCRDGSPPPKQVAEGYTVLGPLTSADWDQLVIEREKLPTFRRHQMEFRRNQSGPGRFRQRRKTDKEVEDDNTDD